MTNFNLVKKIGNTVYGFSEVALYDTNQLVIGYEYQTYKKDNSDGIFKLLSSNTILF